MLIETVHGGMFFSVTYVVAFLLAAGIMIFEGARRGYPRNAWLLILVTSLLFFIIGDKIFTYSPDQWIQVFTRFHFPETEKKTVLGGIVGLTAGLLIAKSWLRFRRPVLDTMAIALPVAMAISRIGCLMAGCCFGTPTNMPWGIEYDAASWAYQVHMAQGLVQIHDAASHAVHPVQLYQVIGCLVIAFVVWRTRKQWRSNGSLFLFSVLCYAALRFFVEFVRAPETSFFAGKVILGLKIIQWYILLGFLAGLIILVIREGKSKTSLQVTKAVSPSDSRLMSLALLLCGIIFFGIRWFTFLEISTILCGMIPVIIVLMVSVYRRNTIAGFRWVIPAVLLCSFSFMAQKSSKKWSPMEKTGFTEIGVTGMAGSYYDKLQRVSGEDCGGYITTPLGTYQRTFYQGGVDVSYNKWRGKYNKLSVGGSAFIGSESGNMKADYPHSALTLGISPYFTYNWHWFGLGTGFSIGQMKLPSGPSFEFKPSTHSHSTGDIVSADYYNRNLVFSINLRVGPSDIFYMEGCYPGLFPSSTPFPMFQVGFGSGLGKTNGTKAGFGVCDDGFYADVNYPFKSNIVLKAFYADNFYSGMKEKRVFSLGISYRIMDEASGTKKDQLLPAGLEPQAFYFNKKGNQ